MKTTLSILILTTLFLSCNSTKFVPTLINVSSNNDATITGALLDTKGVSLGGSGHMRFIDELGEHFVVGTDKKGEFIISLEPGIYSVVPFFLGRYMPRIEKFDFKKGDVLNIDFYMEKAMPLY